MFLCFVLAKEPTLGSCGPVQPIVGEAQRLSSLTFGCIQIRGKSPQVLTGPEPAQRASAPCRIASPHTQTAGDPLLVRRLI